MTIKFIIILFYIILCENYMIELYKRNIWYIRDRKIVKENECRAILFADDMII